jgi:hypothetical protein
MMDCIFWTCLGLRRGFLLAGNCLALALSRASVCPGALTAHGQTSAMADASVASDIHQALDIHLHFAPQGAFHFVVGSDDAANPCHFIICQVANLLIEVDTSPRENVSCSCVTNTKNVCKANFCALFLGKIYTSNTSQADFSLTLTLFVFWILANHPYHALAPDDLTINANLFY